ncbi:MAG TPA: histidinol-phosphate transaminase [Terriglobia bacterium]|nr:histidinol-phosphate transaminase [Terriglobia bacterium]
MKAAAQVSREADLKRHLFYETSHSPSLVDLVGYEKARDIIDFCFIANPYYPTPAMLKDLQENLPSLIKSYPSSNPLMSQKNLAQVLRVNPEHLVIGNGASELITLINETLIDHIAVPIPTFGEYIEKLKHQRDAELYALTGEEDYQLNLEKYLAWVRHRRLNSLLVINPGNPTGQLIALEQMVAFLHRARDIELVIVDESFIDFSGDPIPSLLPLADQFSNLLIVRSMSKHCGVPGLRLGYCYSENLYLLNRLRRNIPTWNVNTLGEYFLSLLPSTDTDYHAARKRLISDVRQLYEGLKSIPGIHVYPTGANFVLFKIKQGMTATELQASLLNDHRMYVRDCSNKLGMDDRHIRVASQGCEKDERLVEALKALAQ